MTFSQKLKTAMENLNLRQVDVANLTGKGKNAISQYIAGKNIPPEKTRKEIENKIKTKKKVKEGQKIALKK